MEKQNFFIEKMQDPLARHGVHVFIWETAPRTVAAAAHVHSDVELLYVISGHFRASVNNRSYELAPGDLILFRSHAIHHAVALEDADNRYYCFKIKASILQELSRSEDAAEYTAFFTLTLSDAPCLWKREALEGSELLGAVRGLIREYEHPCYAPEVGLKLRAAELLLILLREGVEEQQERMPKNEMSACIYRSLVYIHEHFTEELEERALAARFGISYSYYSRFFKHTIGMTFKQYQSMLRANYAEQLLLTTGCSVTEVANECGYNSVSHFIRVYKIWKKVTPKQTALHTAYDRRETERKN